MVGLGGLYFFGEGHVPQDLLQGFDGVIGGSLAAFFAVYLMLSFSPIVVPLRETLVRLSHEQRGQSEADLSRLVKSNTAAADAVLPPLQNAPHRPLPPPLRRSNTPDASSSLFALTGATGVCAIGYAFPIFAYWRLPPEYGGVNTPQVDYLVSRTTSEPYNPLATPPPSRHGRPQWLQSLTSFPFFTSQHHLSPRSAVNAYGPASDPEVASLTDSKLAARKSVATSALPVCVADDLACGVYEASGWRDEMRGVRCAH